MLLNRGAGEDSWESLRQQGNQPVNPKGNEPWIFSGRADTEAPILWAHDGKSCLFGKDPVAGKDWGQRRRGWQRMRQLEYISNSVGRVWANSGRQWRTEKPGMLQSMWSQRVGHNLVTEQQQPTLTVRGDGGFGSTNEIHAIGAKVWVKEPNHLPISADVTSQRKDNTILLMISNRKHGNMCH